MYNVTGKIFKVRKHEYEAIGYYVEPKIVRYELEGPVVENTFVLVNRCLINNQISFKKSKDRPFYRVLLTHQNIADLCTDKHAEKILKSIKNSIESFKEFACVSKKHYDKFGRDFKFVAGATK